MSTQGIERRDAGEAARRLAQASCRATRDDTPRSKQKSVDPRNDRAMAEHAMEQWISETESLSSATSTPSTHSGMPHAQLSRERAVSGAHGGGHAPEEPRADAEPAPVRGKDAEALLGVGIHAAALAATRIHPAIGVGMVAAYWATHAMSHEKEGAEAIAHGASMFHPH